MFSFRNGSLPANALLIAIGAAAGAGVTVLIAPIARDHQAGNDVSGRGSSYAARSGESAKAGKNGTSLQDALRIQDPQQRAASLRDAGAEAAKKDPARAISLGASLTTDQDKLEFLRGIYASWSLSDPVAALDYAKSSMPAGMARTEAIGIAVNKWAAKDPRAAWLWSEENLNGSVKEQAQIDVLIGWTRKTPEAAAQWFVSSGYTSPTLAGVLAATYAEQKPREAFDWARSLRDPAVRRPAIDASARPWLEQNPTEAIPALEPIISTPEGADLPIVIADVWGTTDPAATAEWIKTLPDSSAKNEAAATLATVWAANDINAAVAWSGTLTDEATRRQVITHIGTTWGAIEPDGALAWLYSLPGDLAKDGVIGAFHSWAATDATGLREWVDENPPAAEMDVARMALAEVLADSDIGSSMDLVFQLSSATNRDNAAARYFRHWRRTDDAAAQDWLKQNWSSLEPSTRQRLTVEQQRHLVSR